MPRKEFHEMEVSKPVNVSNGMKERPHAGYYKVEIGKRRDKEVPCGFAEALTAALRDRVRIDLLDEQRRKYAGL